MLSSLLFLVLPALTLAAPPTSPTITKIVFSGSGCPNDSGSVRADTPTLGDSAGVSFSALKGDNTDNCAVHIQSSGATPGWQVAVSQITYEGDVNLRGRSELDTFTQVFWSENAGNTGTLTGSLTCTGPEIREYLTVRSSTADLKWSKCTGDNGSPGILNVNFRPVVQGDFGTYDFKHASWTLVWRKC
ncbi:hypothetical protein HBI56_174870 [Parastagonospora nodorum]|uniref:Secreted protein n=2 Tax=Phaeosphaeria nodorum (strain SN15 / ATCC MYA-4574 / FGSC 10173) TaxID=321614 RepID=A0A7U2I5C3_PHANO|nr:hypothetical protein SNOG_13837 [Parastagonospora nodorum SN15]KAH3911996.1 hypothetical protein HBH56_120330 [Parastagonospora nodorum]EAT78861.1 hypothetical protein SNOG_13837 [Parastagonospora nodorum SN15]KAH3924215.1 hypothetical protein HBH54_196230 [Parastagonospora nodorum]KAH3942449.1 hypothetical protein HBH53_187260 [Parastagonospora nodorum]KAH3961695.1 hypothetical protein HBH51_182460 [Parastagonospora nodorum]